VRSTVACFIEMARSLYVDQMYRTRRCSERRYSAVEYSATEPTSDTGGREPIPTVGGVMVRIEFAQTCPQNGFCWTRTSS